MNAFGKAIPPIIKPVHHWYNPIHLPRMSYKCYYCDNKVASEIGYESPGSGIGQLHAYIYICSCGYPTYFDHIVNQIPLFKFGSNVEYIPTKNVEELYQESRKCYSVGAFTSAILACRKILMNVAADKGAPVGRRFIEYINYLDTNHYIVADSRQYIDQIRNLGNEATNEIAPKTKGDAELAIYFTENLLRNLYEAPGKLQASQQSI